MNMNVNNYQDKQHQVQSQEQEQVQAQDQRDQGQARSQGQGQGQGQYQCKGQKQEQISRLLTLVTPPGQLHGAWIKFLIEVLSVLEEAELIKRVNPENNKYDDKYEW